MSYPPPNTASDRKTAAGYPPPQPNVAVGYPSDGNYDTAAAYSNWTPPPSVYAIPSHGPQTTFVPPTRYYDQNRRLSLGRRLLIAALVIICLTVLAFAIAWLVLKPQLPQFRVDSAFVSHLSATGSEVTARWALTISIDNPNQKLNVHYDQLRALVTHGRYNPLAVTRLQPFKQEKKNKTAVTADLYVLNKYVGKEVVENINREMSGGLVNFGVNVYAWVRFTPGIIWSLRDHMLSVNCHGVTMGFSGNNSTGSMIRASQPRVCRVYA